jgi:hypothetical protein
VLINEAKSLCTTNFECSSFSFDRPDCIAKFGVKSGEASSFWVHHVPNCEISIIASDVVVQDEEWKCVSCKKTFSSTKLCVEKKDF